MNEEMIRESRPFRLNALHTRMALSRLVDRFPLKNDRTPLGLELLFQVLGRLGLDEVVAYGEMLEVAEVNLLSGYFDRTDNTRVILAIALILASRKDHRAIGPIRRWLHYLPPAAELNFLRQIWNARGFRELFAGEVVWLHDLMAHREQPLLAFLLAQIGSGCLTLKDLVMGLPDEVTPLIEALEKAIFAKGGVGLVQILPARAYQLAEAFLKNNQDEPVRGYFINCSESRWPISLVRLVYQQKGSPDASRHPFYAGLPRGTIWGLRRQLYQTLVAEGGLDLRRVTFWKRYLHHAQDVFWQGQILVFVIHPMRIFEKAGLTEVMLGNQPDRPVTIPLDAMWEIEMATMLNDYIQWGQAR